MQGLGKDGTDQGNSGGFYGGNAMFYGAGVTDTASNPGYIGYNTAQHDYENVFLVGWHANDQVLSVGPIQNDPGDVPYD